MLVLLWFDTARYDIMFIYIALPGLNNMLPNFNKVKKQIWKHEFDIEAVYLLLPKNNVIRGLGNLCWHESSRS